MVQSVVTTPALLYLQEKVSFGRIISIGQGILIKCKITFDLQHILSQTFTISTLKITKKNFASLFSRRENLNSILWGHYQLTAASHICSYPHDLQECSHVGNVCRPCHA